MPWMELSVHITEEAIDWVNTLLATTDYAGEVYLTRYAPFDQLELSELGDRESTLWTSTIRLYLPNDANSNACLKKIVGQFLPLQRVGLMSPLQTQWVDEKLASLTTLNPQVYPLGERFVVVAANHSDRLESDLLKSALFETDRFTTEGRMTLRLNKTLTFGSGLHPATAISLKLLERHVMPRMTALDLGSGSGILSVAMAKLGAQVLALDNDDIAVRATQNAVVQNGVEHQVTAMLGSLGQGSSLGHWMGGDSINHTPTIQPAAKFDLIVTNILARVHIALADDYCHALSQTDSRSGLLITAGFTRDYEQEVKMALTAAGFELIDREQFNEWVALAHRLTGKYQDGSTRLKLS